MIPETHLWVASKTMRGWQANLKRTCALPVKCRAMPENEIPPAIELPQIVRTVQKAPCG